MLYYSHHHRPTTSDITLLVIDNVYACHSHKTTQHNQEMSVFYFLVCLKRKLYVEMKALWYSLSLVVSFSC